MAKLYPFSVKKHQHDITLTFNRLRNEIVDLEDELFENKTLSKEERKIRFDRIDKLEELVEKYRPIYHAVYSNYPIVWLNGKDYGIAKEMAIAAIEYRAKKVIETGRLYNLQYV